MATSSTAPSSTPAGCRRCRRCSVFGVRCWVLGVRIPDTWCLKCPTRPSRVTYHVSHRTPNTQHRTPNTEHLLRPPGLAAVVGDELGVAALDLDVVEGFLTAGAAE